MFTQATVIVKNSEGTIAALRTVGLDEKTVDEAVAALRVRFPDHEIDLSQIEAARKANAARVA